MKTGLARLSVTVLLQVLCLPLNSYLPKLRNPHSENNGPHAAMSNVTASHFLLDKKFATIVLLFLYFIEGASTTKDTVIRVFFSSALSASRQCSLVIDSPVHQ